MEEAESDSGVWIEGRGRKGDSGTAVASNDSGKRRSVWHGYGESFQRKIKYLINGYELRGFIPKTGRPLALAGPHKNARRAAGERRATAPQEGGGGGREQRE